MNGCGLDRNDRNLLKEEKSLIIDLFRKLGIIRERSNQEVTIKLVDGGILYIRVKEEKTIK